MAGFFNLLLFGHLLAVYHMRAHTCYNHKQENNCIDCNYYNRHNSP